MSPKMVYLKIINEQIDFPNFFEAIATAIPPTPNPAAKAVISISNTVAKTVKTPNMTIIIKREERMEQTDHLIY